MMISTKGRYALRVMINLADNMHHEYIPLKDIAEREGISQKYLESIMTLLSKAGLVAAQHGKGGGYMLNRAPNEYSVGEILDLTEGSLAPVACLDKSAQKPCERAAECRTLPMWQELNDLIHEFLYQYPLSNLLSTSEFNA